jgi:hypothetical protein
MFLQGWRGKVPPSPMNVRSSTMNVWTSTMDVRTPPMAELFHASLAFLPSQGAGKDALI